MHGEGEGKVGEGSSKGKQEHARARNNSHTAMELGGGDCAGNKTFIVAEC